MIWQNVVTGVIVAISALYLIRSAIRSLRGRKNSCDCGQTCRNNGPEVVAIESRTPRSSPESECER